VEQPRLADPGKRNRWALIAWLVLALFAAFWFSIALTPTDRVFATVLVVVAIGTIGFALDFGKFAPAIFAFVCVPTIFFLCAHLTDWLETYRRWYTVDHVLWLSKSHHLRVYPEALAIGVLVLTLGAGTLAVLFVEEWSGRKRLAVGTLYLIVLGSVELFTTYGHFLFAVH
jgi:hypothetical protein